MVSKSKFYFFVLMIFCPLDPHIFADPDSERQNLADPTDPDQILGTANIRFAYFEKLQMKIINFKHTNIDIFFNT